MDWAQTTRFLDKVSTKNWTLKHGLERKKYFGTSTEKMDFQSGMITHGSNSKIGLEQGINRKKWILKTDSI
jgi:hypothetical protein